MLPGEWIPRRVPVLQRRLRQAGVALAEGIPLALGSRDLESLCRWPVYDELVVPQCVLGGCENGVYAVRNDLCNGLGLLTLTWWSPYDEDPKGLTQPGVGRICFLSVSDATFHGCAGPLCVCGSVWFEGIASRFRSHCSRCAVKLAWRSVKWLAGTRWRPLDGRQKAADCPYAVIGATGKARLPHGTPATHSGRRPPHHKYPWHLPSFMRQLGLCLTPFGREYHLPLQ